MQDVYDDARQEYKFSEVALDYNTLFTAALGATTAAPPDVWASSCAKHVNKYPWDEAEKNAGNWKRGDTPAPNVGSAAAELKGTSSQNDKYELVKNEAGSASQGGSDADTSSNPSPQSQPSSNPSPQDQQQSQPAPQTQPTTQPNEPVSQPTTQPVQPRVSGSTGPGGTTSAAPNNRRRLRAAEAH